MDDDPNCLAALKHYRSLMPLAQEARKPMFHLKAADGALGGHAKHGRVGEELCRGLVAGGAEEREEADDLPASQARRPAVVDLDLAAEDRNCPITTGLRGTRPSSRGSK